MPAFDPVTALMRGLEVLRLTNQLEHASITEIHKQSGIPKATVLRMLETLINAGFVARIDGTATYTPTGRCLLLSNGLQMQARLVAVAAPHLSAFRKKVGWPSDLGIFDGDAMVIAATSREFGVLSLNRKVGARTPMLLSALGRAYFSYCGDKVQARIVDLLGNSTNPLDRLASSPRDIAQIVKETRSRGYSLTDTQYLDTVYQGAIWGVGIPIMAGDQVMAAMNVMFLRNALSLRKGIEVLVPHLKRTAAAIGQDFERDSLSFTQ